MASSTPSNQPQENTMANLVPSDSSSPDLSGYNLTSQQESEVQDYLASGETLSDALEAVGAGDSTAIAPVTAGGSVAAPTAQRRDVAGQDVIQEVQGKRIADSGYQQGQRFAKQALDLHLTGFQQGLQDGVNQAQKDEAEYKSGAIDWLTNLWAN